MDDSDQLFHSEKLGTTSDHTIQLEIQKSWAKTPSTEDSDDAHPLT